MATVKIDKVGIAYSKSGVDQKAFFMFEDDKLITREFQASYNDPVYIPDDVVTLRELLRFMASYSYHYRFVKIISINNKSKKYEYRFDSTEINRLRAEVDEFEKSVAIKFFISHLVPIIKQRNWFFGPTAMTGRPTIAYIDKKTGEADNVYRENRILKRLNKMCGTFKEDYSLNNFVGLFISEDLLKSYDLYRDDF